MFLMDVWSVDKSARAIKQDVIHYAFNNPMFAIGELHWIPVVANRVNKYLMQAREDSWMILDKDFSKEVESDFSASEMPSE